MKKITQKLIYISNKLILLLLTIEKKWSNINIKQKNKCNIKYYILYK